MYATMKIGPYTTTATKKMKAVVLAKINKFGYVLNDSRTKITSQLFEKRGRSITIVNNVKMKHKKTLIIENKQTSSTGPSLRTCLRNDGSTIGVTIVHNVIVCVGILEGTKDGAAVGNLDCNEDGNIVGASDSIRLGILVGLSDGLSLGIVVGVGSS
uniref:Uncharacterized protein n=1 Tax=Proboscia inermis TaxID=420281 RepID=A0A7S0GMN8_9STRA